MAVITIETDGKRALAEELAILQERIVENIHRADKYVTGKMAGSIRHEVSGSGSEVSGSLTAAPFFAVLETGSRPWRKQYIHPPRLFRETIREWISNRGLDLSPYLVARKIMRKGSKLYREGGREDIFTVEIPIFAEKLTRRLSGIATAEIEAPIMRLEQKIEG